MPNPRRREIGDPTMSTVRESPAHEAPASADEPRSEELVARARGLRERLRELQGEHAKLGTYSPEIHEAFTDARLYDLLRPKRHGGLEASIETGCRVPMQLSRGGRGVGWSWEHGASHAYQAASHLPEQAQEEAFGSADPFISPSRAFPQKAQVTKGEGG